MKDDVTEERPTTDGEQTNEPSQENGVGNGENGADVTVNVENGVSSEENTGDKGEEIQAAVTEAEDKAEDADADANKAEDTDANKVEDADVSTADNADVSTADDADASKPEDADASKPEDADAGTNEAEDADNANKVEDSDNTNIAEDTDTSKAAEDSTTNETEAMTTKEVNEINANDTAKVNGEVENGPEKQVTETPSNTELKESADVVEELKSEDIEFPRERRLTAYQRLSNDLSGDHKVLKEITLGKRIGFYRIRGELGSGNFSQVKMGIHALTKEKVAVKILDKTKLDKKTQKLLSREISSMDHMHHPNIIRLYEVVETLAKLHIVMEYAGGGELFNKISNEGKIAENEAKIVYAQVIAALQHMHEKDIIHRDLKAENVFYAGPRFVKVGDFGFSTTCKPDQTLNTFCGSPPYAAPELFKDEHYYGAFVDIWAMGIMLYFMVCGIMPFRADTVSKLKKCILEGTFVIPNFVSDSCQFLIRGILKPVPHDRFSLSEIRRSDWLEGQEFPEALPPYNMNPSADGVELAEDELETRAILHDLGINEAHIRECHGKDSRSSINGTYRIVLHKVQRRRSGRVIDPGEEFEPETDEKGNKNKGTGKKTSKFCVIL